jgi:hypothetical protein
MSAGHTGLAETCGFEAEIATVKRQFSGIYGFVVIITRGRKTQGGYLVVFSTGKECWRKPVNTGESALMPNKIRKISDAVP